MFEIILHEEVGYPAWLSKEAISILKGVSQSIISTWQLEPHGLLISTYVCLMILLFASMNFYVFTHS